MWSLCALFIGFGIDLIVGDPHSIPHPVIFIGKLISAIEKVVRKTFPKTVRGENVAGCVLWLLVVVISTAVPALLLWLSYGLNTWLGLALESIMCWQILATKSLKDESMKVYAALKTGNIEKSRYAVSMIVGRDTAVNTMDSMLGYVEMPYKNIGLVPAKMDDVMNFIPSRLSALIMLFAGWLLKLNVKNGWKVFRRDRFNHASPNSAQTESVCAGLLGLRLAGDAWYHGELHKKKFIGDALREIEYEDIQRACRLLYVTAVLSLVLFCGLKLLFLVVI